MVTRQRQVNSCLSHRHLAVKILLNNQFRKLRNSVYVCFLMFLFCFVPFFSSLIFQADTNSILFHLVFENLILHIFLIIMIIMPCSGMFRNVPCSSFYRRPVKNEIMLLTYETNGSGIHSRGQFSYHR